MVAVISWWALDDLPIRAALKPLADHHLQITCQSLSLLDEHHIRCERRRSCRPTEDTLSIDTASHLYVTHSHCMQHTGNPPCNLCLMYTAWHRESLKLKKKFGTREVFEICPNQFFHPLIPPPPPGMSGDLGLGGTHNGGHGSRGGQAG